MSAATPSAKTLLVLALLTLAGCDLPPPDLKEPYCPYYDWAINGAKDMRQCIDAGTCKPTATEYAEMRRRERTCPWKFQGVEK